MEAWLAYAVFVALSLALAGLLLKDPSLRAARNDDFASFQRRYFVVYFLVTTADWLQGPYLYRLYEEYGFQQHDIAALYIVGFSSAMLFGPLLGGLADTYGRKRLSWWCCGLYSLSCLLKVTPHFGVLLLGRILGGLSTCLLFSTFESWMVFEHNKAGFPADWLPRTFAMATFGNGVVAVLAGVLANFVTDGMGSHSRTLPPRLLLACCAGCSPPTPHGVPTTHSPTLPCLAARPFLVAIVFLAAGAVMIRRTWVENTPVAAAPGAAMPMPPLPAALPGPATGCLASLRPIVRNRKIWMLALVQAFFEAGMYLFVFLWTPALVRRGGLMQGGGWRRLFDPTNRQARLTGPRRHGGPPAAGRHLCRLYACHHAGQRPVPPGHRARPARHAHAACCPRRGHGRPRCRVRHAQHARALFPLCCL